MVLIHSPPGICSDFYVFECVRTLKRLTKANQKLPLSSRPIDD